MTTCPQAPTISSTSTDAVSVLPAPRLASNAMTLVNSDVGMARSGAVEIEHLDHSLRSP